jgi:hypothetical protein
VNLTARQRDKLKIKTTIRRPQLITATGARFILTSNRTDKYIEVMMESAAVKQCDRTADSPKAIIVAGQKERFIAALRSNGGNVSLALKQSGLARKTAYAHRNSDSEFAAAWQQAQEEALDELYSEARRRALEGEKIISPKTGQVITKKSDTMLIFLLKQGERNKKWRARLIQTGKLAVESLRASGIKYRLSDDVVRAMEKDLLEGFNQVQLD